MALARVLDGRWQRNVAASLWDLLLGIPTVSRFLPQRYAIPRLLVTSRSL